MATPDEMRRLAFIKYLYELAVAQSKRTDLTRAASVLTFHDAAESFLILSAQRVGAKTDCKFMERFKYLGDKDVHLEHRESMRTLNELRNSLKHAGVLPNDVEVESARANVTSFFLENTPLVFDGLRFADISMVQVVQHEMAKACLEMAQTQMAAEDLDPAIWMITWAFHELVESHIHPGLESEGSMLFGGRPLVDKDRERDDGTKENIEDAATRRMSDDVETLRQAVTVLSLGIDYRRYLRFRSIAHTYRPVQYEAGGEVVEVMVTEARNGQPTAEDCRFCFDFVIDSAMRLQEFDFDTK